MIGLVTYLDYIKIILTATNIRIMEEIAENKLFGLIGHGFVCTNRSDRSAWRYAVLRGSTGQTGGQNRSDRSNPGIPFQS